MSKTTKARRRYRWIEGRWIKGGRKRVMVYVHPTTGEEGYIARGTDSCTGCFEFGDYDGLAHNYPWDEKAQCRVGTGCDECGYTGKRRTKWFIPFGDARPTPTPAALSGAPSHA